MYSEHKSSRFKAQSGKKEAVWSDQTQSDPLIRPMVLHINRLLFAR